MIVFVPAYDDATRANLAVAQDLQANKDGAHLNARPGDDVPTASAHQGCRLFENDAMRAALLAALNAHSDPLFAMSHGKPDHLRAQHGAVALSISDATILGNRTVFAFACHTSASLGRELAQGGVTWWGYIKEVTAPAQQEPFRSLFVGIFSYIYDSFFAATSSDARLDVIQCIKQLCDAASAKVDEFAEADGSLDVFEAYQSLRDIWQLLRVWSPQAESAEKHASAPDILPRYRF